LDATAQEVTSRGGKGIAVYCDHGNAEDIKSLFDRIKKEQNGQLDILINNAYSAVNTITSLEGKKFYETDISIWDEVNNVGLRNHYICSVYASQMMIPRKSGLIVTISSPGGLRYLFNIAYGVGKAACDRLAADMAVELRPHNICSISLWPGAVKTELVDKNVLTRKDKPDASEAAIRAARQTRAMFENGESTEFSGICLRSLAADKDRMRRSGYIWTTGDLAYDYSLVDLDGRTIPSVRMVKQLLQFGGHTWAAAVVPSFVRIPGWMVTAMNSKL